MNSYIVNRKIIASVIVLILSFVSFKQSYAQCTSAFTTNSSIIGCEDLGTQFIDKSIGFVSNRIWNFGVGLPTSAQSPYKVFKSNGGITLYDVSLTITCLGGLISTATKTVTVLPKPKAEFRFDKIPVCAIVEQMKIINTSPTSPGITFTWDLGDNTTTTSFNPIHTFNASGSYNVILNVNNGICINTVFDRFDVYPTPNPEFVVDQSLGCLPAKAPLLDRTVQNEIFRLYEWDMGDGSPLRIISPVDPTFSLNRVPTYTYSSPGTFPIRLSITNRSGCRNTTLNYFSVANRPTVTGSTTFSSQNVCEDQDFNISFTPPPLPNDQNVKFDFGLATIISSTTTPGGVINIVLRYNSPFMATVNTVTGFSENDITIISGNLACPIIERFKIFVIPIKKLDFSYQDSRPQACRGNSKKVFVSPSGYPSYNFYDYTLLSSTLLGTTSTPSFTVPNIQSDKPLKVTAINSQGCNDVGYGNIVLVELPVGTLTSNITTFCDNATPLLTSLPLGMTDYEFYKSAISMINSDANEYTMATITNTVTVASQLTNMFGCRSFTNLIEIKKTASLNPPTVNCAGSTFTSLGFRWASVLGVNLYEVSVNNGPFISPSSPTGLFHSVSGLNANDPVSIIVRASNMNNLPCATSVVSSSMTCIANNCSDISFVMNDPVPNPFCINDNIKFSVSNISATGLNYSISWDNGPFSSNETYTIVGTNTLTSVSAILRDNTLATTCSTPKLFAYVTPKGSANFSASLNRSGYCSGDTVTLKTSLDVSLYNVTPSNLKGSPLNGVTKKILPSLQTEYKFLASSSGKVYIDPMTTSGICFTSPASILNYNYTVKNLSMSSSLLGTTNLCRGKSLNTPITLTGSSGWQNYTFFESITQLQTGSSNKNVYNGAIKDGFLFYVIATNNGCTDTSRLLNVTPINIVDNPVIIPGLVSKDLICKVGTETRKFQIFPVNTSMLPFKYNYQNNSKIDQSGYNAQITGANNNNIQFIINPQTLDYSGYPYLVKNNPPLANFTLSVTSINNCVTTVNWVTQDTIRITSRMRQSQAWTARLTCADSMKLNVLTIRNAIDTIKSVRFDGLRYQWSLQSVDSALYPIDLSNGLPIKPYKSNNYIRSYKIDRIDSLVNNNYKLALYTYDSLTKCSALDSIVFQRIKLPETNLESQFCVNKDSLYLVPKEKGFGISHFWSSPNNSIPIINPSKDTLRIPSIRSKYLAKDNSCKLEAFDQTGIIMLKGEKEAPKNLKVTSTSFNYNYCLVNCGETPFVPNAISPNGDGKNDTWIIDNFPSPFKVEVYSRWGELVFSNNNYKNDWRATGLSGADLPDGTYFYHVMPPKGGVYNPFSIVNNSKVYSCETKEVEQTKGVLLIQR